MTRARSNGTLRKRLSVLLYEKVILSPIPQYELAQRIKLNPSVLNRAIHGAEVNTTDPRWRLLAKLVGVESTKVFEL